MAAHPDDLKYCRAVLPRVSRTFALNIRLLPGSLRDVVGSAYLLCRTADALEDSWPGRPEEIEARFARLRTAIDGDPGAAGALAAEAAVLPGGREDLDLVRHFPAVWRVFRSFDDGDRTAIGEAVHVMAEGMCRYAARAAGRDGPGPAFGGYPAPYLDDEAELDDYCWVVAGCVGVMLTRLQMAREPGPVEGPARLALSPIVGRALQLTNILLDWPQDVRRGRCYVPRAWLDAHGVRPADLVGAPSAAATALCDRLEWLARAALARVPDYLDLTPANARRYRLFVLLPAFWALRSIERARREPEFPWGERRPKLSRIQLWSSGLAAWSGTGALGALRTCNSGPH